MLVPLGALTGFSLAAEVRLVAAYYGVRARSLRTVRGPVSERMALARHALSWRLVHVHGFSARRAAQMLGVPPQTVHYGATTHQARIAEFQATAGGMAPLAVASSPAEEDPA
mgnify:CR=1 FL=1